jgi:two-component system response regulator HydG
VLVVEDEPDDGEALELWLERAGCAVTSVRSAVQALEKIGTEDFDLVLTDLAMSEMNGLDLCEHILGIRPDMPVIVVTGMGSLEAAVSALRVGAYDFITKPVDPELLTHAVSRAVQHRHLRDELKRLRETMPDSSTNPDLIGESAAMRPVHELIARVADSNTSVLIQGETGTGKELIARAIHARSRRSKGPFVALNCAAVPHALLESELFGHARGAFTDAKSLRTGLLRQAHGGTLFLDEIGDLPLEMQPKLLRALQERTVRPVGADIEVAFDARIITATNRDLEYEVLEKRFRDDLFYRLNVIEIWIPPLRERREDIPLLARHFIEVLHHELGKDVVDLSEGALKVLLDHSWPGNVRELENAVERAMVTAKAPVLGEEDFAFLARQQNGKKTWEVPPNTTMAELEKLAITATLERTQGNIKAAAAVLDIDRSTLYEKLKRYQIARP